MLQHEDEGRSVTIPAPDLPEFVAFGLRVLCARANVVEDDATEAGALRLLARMRSELKRHSDLPEGCVLQQWLEEHIPEVRTLVTHSRIVLPDVVLRTEIIRMRLHRVFATVELPNALKRAVRTLDRKKVAA